MNPKKGTTMGPLGKGLGIRLKFLRTLGLRFSGLRGI